MKRKYEEPTVQFFDTVPDAIACSAPVQVNLKQTPLDLDGMDGGGQNAYFRFWK